MPKDYDAQKALSKPGELIVWLYENQGEQRFGADNRLFVVLLDKDNRDNNWKLKRDFKLVFTYIDKLFDTERVTERDQITFTYEGKTYSPLSKILLITR